MHSALPKKETEKMFFRVLASVVSGYLIGSVMSAIIISNIVYREDVRRHGSGNSGATNAARVYGAVIGILTYLGDFGKGVLACVLGRLIGGWTGDAAGICLAIAGFAAVIGHSFPVFYRFKGGKGVATGSAVAFMLDWRIFVIAIIVFLAVALITKRVSAGSLAGCIAVAIGSIIFAKLPVQRILGVLTALVVIAMHWQNIQRIMAGEEKPFVFGKPRKPERPPRVK